MISRLQNIKKLYFYSPQRDSMDVFVRTGLMALTSQCARHSVTALYMELHVIPTVALQKTDAVVIPI